SRVASPSWIDPPAGFEVAPLSPPFPASEVLASRTKLIHLSSIEAGREFECPQTLAFFSPVALDYDFDLFAPEPRLWLDFLNRLWPSDAQSINTLQEWFGY